MDVGGVCCVGIEISWIRFFVLKVNVVCCGRVVDKIFELLGILMIGITYRGFFLLARGMVGRTYCAFFDMVRDYLFLECICTGGAVGVTEYIAWFSDFFFLGQRGIKCHVFCACNVVLMACVLTVSVALAGNLFVLVLIRDVFFRGRL